MNKKDKRNLLLFICFFFSIILLSRIGRINDSFPAMLLVLASYDLLGNLLFFGKTHYIIDTKKIIMLLSGLYAGYFIIVINIILLYILPPILLSLLIKRESDKNRIKFDNEWIIASTIALAMCFFLENINVISDIKHFLVVATMVIGAIASQFSSGIELMEKDDKLELKIDKWSIDIIMKTIYLIIILFITEHIMVASNFIYLGMFLLLLTSLEETLGRLVLNNVKWHNLLVDDLTGAYNKNYLKRIISEKVNRKEKFTLIMIDLNDFKEVNDTYGHVVGDNVLIHFTKILTKVVRGSDVYRYGGDEFCLIIDGVGVSELIISRIDKCLKQAPYFIGDQEIVLSASFGAVNSFDKGIDSEEFISVADANMYKDKTRRKIQPLHPRRENLKKKK